MDKLIARFPEQLSEALKIGADFSPKDTSITLKNVVISGLGGSGIGGTIVRNYALPKACIPITVNKTYTLPEFVDHDTLLICCSYSGNTEETISVFHEGVLRGAKILVISSGGQLIHLAHQHQIDYIKIPDGMPPRSCLGYSLVQLLYALYSFKIINSDFEQEINAAIDIISQGQNNIIELAKNIAEQIFNKTPIIYTESSIEGIAIRWRQQLNENSKILCWHHVIPEMNHNELVGWDAPEMDKAVIFLRHSYEYPRSSYRIDIFKQIIADKSETIIDIQAKGSSYLEECIYLIHLGDWVSWKLSLLRNVDANEVKLIDYIKEQLAKQ